MTSLKNLILVSILFCSMFYLTAQAALQGDEASNSSLAASPSGPLTLNQCIELALQRHPLLQSARHQIANAEAGIKVSKSAARPQVGLAGGYTQNNGQPSGGIVSSLPEGFSAGVVAKQLISDGGRTTASIQSAKYTFASTTASYNEVEQNVILGARQGYYGVLAAEQLVDAQVQARNLSELHTIQAKARYDEGIAPKADVTKAEVELANAELSLIRARNNVSLAYGSLNNALGLPITTILKLSGTIKSQQIQPSLEDSLSAACANRPELKRIEAQVQSAQSEIQVAGSARKPVLYLTGGDVWPRTSGGIRSDDETTWTVGITASISLSDGGATKAHVQQACENVAKLKSDLENEKQQIELEVQQTLLNVIEADQRVTTSTRLVDQAEENYRIAQGRYKEGIGPMIDVVDAETTLTAARASHVQAELDSLTSRAKLDNATGQGLSREGTMNEK
ncbi:MAG: TolC family protein [Armatimonadota bacterium]